jgi:hypothetical protein
MRLEIRKSLFRWRESYVGVSCLEGIIDYYQSPCFMPVPKSKKELREVVARAGTVGSVLTDCSGIYDLSCAVDRNTRR